MKHLPPRGSLEEMMDFDFIVIGSGFGGSVSAHRLTEKGYRVAVMEMGRRWTPENLPIDQLAALALDLAAGPRVARLLQHRALPPRVDHAWLCGGRRVHHLRQYAAGPGRLDLGNRIVGRSGGLESRDAAPLRDRRAHAGRDGKPDPGPGGSHPAAGGGRPRASARPSIRTHVAVFEGPEGEPPRPDLSRSVFRRRGTGAHHLHRLRRLHDGVPLQRQEHARTRTISTWPRSTAPGCSPKPRWWMSGPGGQAPMAATATRCSRFQSTSWLRRRRAPLHLPRRGLRGLGAGHHGSAIPAEGEGLAARRSAINWATACAPTAESLIGVRVPGSRRGSVARASPSVPASTWTSTRTSRRPATRRAPTPWACWLPC